MITLAEYDYQNECYIAYSDNAPVRVERPHIKRIVFRESPDIGVGGDGADQGSMGPLALKDLFNLEYATPHFLLSHASLLCTW